MSKRALVTGANRGIGLAIAQGLAARGHRLLLGCRDQKAGEKAAQKIGRDSVAVTLDMADPDSIAAAVAHIGTVDILVNNAGILGSGGVLDDAQDFASCLQVMVHGPYQLMHLLVPKMHKQNHGRIVNVSSGWGAFSDGIAGPGGYGVAKAALNALTVAAAKSSPKTVKINAMCPGWVRTRMGGMGASRSPEQGADTAIWLATLDENGPSGGFFRDRRPIAW